MWKCRNSLFFFCQLTNILEHKLFVWYVVVTCLGFDNHIFYAPLFFHKYFLKNWTFFKIKKKKKKPSHFLWSFVLVFLCLLHTCSTAVFYSLLVFLSKRVRTYTQKNTQHYVYVFFFFFDRNTMFMLVLLYLG